MTTSDSIRTTRRLALALALAGFIAEPALAQATASATVTVRIRPRAAADYDLSSEVILRGQVVAHEKGIIRLRLSPGVVRVDTGAWNGSDLLQPGTAIEVVAAKRQEDGRQRHIAREIRHAGGVVVIRDAQGVPLF